MLNKEYLKRVV